MCANNKSRDQADALNIPVLDLVVVHLPRNSRLEFSRARRNGSIAITSRTIFPSDSATKLRSFKRCVRSVERWETLKTWWFQVLYCDGCRESCHPKRGPLAAHNLGPPRGSWQSNGAKGSRGLAAEPTPVCNDHNCEPLTLYCALCKIAICALCLRDRHATHPHDVLPLAAACKAQKVSLFNLALRSFGSYCLSLEKHAREIYSRP